MDIDKLISQAVKTDEDLCCDLEKAKKESAKLQPQINSLSVEIEDLAFRFEAARSTGGDAARLAQITASLDEKIGERDALREKSSALTGELAKQIQDNRRTLIDPFSAWLRCVARENSAEKKLKEFADSTAKEIEKGKLPLSEARELFTKAYEKINSWPPNESPMPFSVGPGHWHLSVPRLSDFFHTQPVKKTATEQYVKLPGITFRSEEGTTSIL